MLMEYTARLIQSCKMTQYCIFTLLLTADKCTNILTTQQQKLEAPLRKRTYEPQTKTSLVHFQPGDLCCKSSFSSLFLSSLCASLIVIKTPAKYWKWQSGQYSKYIYSYRNKWHKWSALLLFSVCDSSAVTTQILVSSQMPNELVLGLHVITYKYQEMTSLLVCVKLFYLKII